MGQTGANTEITAVQPPARACLGSLELEAAREDSALGVLGWLTPAVHKLTPSTEGEETPTVLVDVCGPLLWQPQDARGQLVLVEPTLWSGDAAFSQACLVFAAHPAFCKCF